ncbi:MAG: 2TM domain-containing protein [Anaerolineae bacterium]|nr:2TM domain-containing protein [Anaerolineae bacterium]
MSENRPSRHSTTLAQYDDEFAPLSDNAALRRRVERQLNKRREFMISLGAYIVINAGLLVAFGAAGMLWIAGVVALGWGAGVAAHGIDTWYQTGRRAAGRLAGMHQAFRDAYGPDWYETATPKQLQAVRRRVDEPINKRKEFAMHAAVFALIIPMLWLLYFTLTPDIIMWPLIAMAGWGFGLLGHGVSVFASNRQEDAVAREMERQRALIDAAQWDGEKAKNDFREDGARLDEDGELTDSMAREIEREINRSRR